MVVEPKYQRQNLGKQMILAIISLARQKSAALLTLNSRIPAVSFYEKLGFITCGAEFPSPTTGVIHISMMRKL